MGWSLPRTETRFHVLCFSFRLRLLRSQFAVEFGRFFDGRTEFFAVVGFGNPTEDPGLLALRIPDISVCSRTSLKLFRPDPVTAQNGYVFHDGQA